MTTPPDTQSLDDSQMKAMIEDQVLGLDEKTALIRLKESGFSDGSVISEPEENRQVWCMKEDKIDFWVVKKWNATLLIEDSGKVGAVEVSSGLVGP